MDSRRLLTDRGETMSKPTLVDMTEYKAGLKKLYRKAIDEWVDSEKFFRAFCRNRGIDSPEYDAPIERIHESAKEKTKKFDEELEKL